MSDNSVESSSSLENGSDFNVVIEGSRPWGFTLQGGVDFRSPLVVGKVTPNGKAEKVGLLPGDIILQVNGISTSSMKHHEAQRLIAASKQTLELKCSKARPSSMLTPKSSTPGSSFSYPSPPDSPGKDTQTAKVGKHIRQRSLDFHPSTFRPRSTSDAGKRATVGEKIAGIKVPAPPPSIKKKTNPSTVEPAPRYVAGIKVPAPPPSLKRKSTGSAPMEEPSSTSSTDDSTIAATNVEISNGDKVESDKGESFSVSSYDAQLNSIQHVTCSKEQVQHDSPKERNNEYQVSDILSAIQSEFGAKTETVSSTDALTLDALGKDTSIDDSVSSETMSSLNDDPVTSSGGVDWYRSMFQSMKKGVEEELPNKKHVCDRSPVPAHKSIFNKTDDQLNIESETAKLKRRYSESSIPTKRSMKRVRSTGNASANADAINTLDSGVVFRKNMQSFNSSRNYWKTIEKQASIERIELAAQAKRHSLRRNSSTSSTGAVSPEEKHLVEEKHSNNDNTALDNKNLPVFQEEVSEKRELSPVISPIISSPTSVSPTVVASDVTSDVTSDVPLSSPKVINESNTEYNTIETMSKLHPLLNEGVAVEDDKSSHTDVSDPSQPSIFTRIDPTKLNSALGNATVLGKMKQEGVDAVALQTTAIALGQQQNAEPVPQERKKSKTIKPPPGEKAKALFDFEAASDKEVSFKKGAVIDLIETINSDWLKGSIDGQVGMLPVSFVKVLAPDEVLQLSLGVDVDSEQSLNLLAQAKYDFNAQSTKELSFSKGDILTLLKQVDDNWYEGSLGDNKGYVPATYIQIFDQEH